MDEHDERLHNYWEDNEEFPSSDWIDEVRNGDTRRGYWSWVAAKMEEKEND